MTSCLRAWARARTGSLLVSSLFVIGLGALAAGCGLNSQGSSGFALGPGGVVITKFSGDLQTGPPRTALPKPLVAKVTDGGGNVLVGVPVVWTVQSGGGSVAATIAPTDTQGLSQTTLALGNSAGTNTVAATVGGSSVTFTENAVGSAGPLKMFISGFPSSAAFGVPGTVVVQVVDTGTGLVDASYAGTVTITSTDPGATLPPVYTFTAGDAGVHSFPVTLNTIGTWSITATDNSLPPLTATESPISVTSGPPTKFLVNGMPSPYSQGAVSDIVVTAQDAGGFTATTYIGTVSFSSTDGGAGAFVPAPYTFTALDAGVHRFKVGVKLVTVGVQTVTATDPLAVLTGSQTVTVAGTVRVTSFTAASSKPNIGTTGSATDALSWTFTGAPGTVTLNGTGIGATPESTTSPGGTTPPAPFPTTPTVPDPRAFYRLTATGPATENVEATQDSQASTAATANGTATFPDNSYVVVGSFSGKATFSATVGPSSAGGKDIFVARYDKTGALIWAKTAGSATDDEAMAVSAFRDGSCVVTGYFTGAATFSGTPLVAAGAGKNVFVARYKSDGTLDWVKKGGGATDAVGQGVSFYLDGGLVVTGFYTGAAATFGSATLSSAGGNDVFVARYAPNGTVIWAKSGGGAGDDRGFGVATTPDAHSIVTGQCAGSATFGGTVLTSLGGTDAFVVSYNIDGSVAWGHNLSVAAGVNQGLAATTFGDGSSAVTGLFHGISTFVGPGTTLTSAGGADAWVAKYGPTGTLIWAKSAGGPTDDAGNGISAFPDGSVAVAGSYHGAALFSGTPLTAVGGADGFYARYDGAAGALDKVLSFGAGGDDSGNAASTFADGSVMIAGSFNASAIFGPGVAEDAGGAPDEFAVKYSPVNFRMLQLRPSGIDYADDSSDGASFSNNTVAYFVTPTSDGGSISIGYYLDDGANAVVIGGVTMPLIGGYNMFLVRYNADGTVAFATAPTIPFGGDVEGYGVAAFPDGSFVVAGHNYGGTTIDFGSGITTASPGAPFGSPFIYAYPFVARYSAAGKCTAATQFKFAGFDYFGGIGSNAEGSLQVCAFADGTYAIAGGYTGTASFGGGVSVTSVGTTFDAFIAHFAATAPTVITADWANSGADVGDSATCFAIAAAEDGSCVAIGSFFNTTAGSTASATFTTSSGSTITLKDSAASLGAGSSYEDLFVVRYDAAGKILWAKGSLNADASGATGASICETYGVTICHDGTLRVGGFVDDSVTFGSGEPKATTLTTGSSSGATNRNPYVASFNLSDGTLNWATNMTTTAASGSYAQAVSVRPDGSCVVAGFFDTSTLTVGSTVLTPTFGGSDIFVACYASDGTVLWAKQGVSGDGFAYGVATLPDTSVVVVGSYGFGLSQTLGPGEPNFQTLSNGTTGCADFFIGKYFDY